MTNPYVNTVLGRLPADNIGHTQMHEHVLADFRSTNNRLPNLLVDGDGIAPPPEEIPATLRFKLEEPVNSENAEWIRRHGYNHDNLAFNDEKLIAAELELYRLSGGGTVVDCTSVGIGRDPMGLVRIARRTGLNIVMGAGYYVESFHPPVVATRTVSEIAEKIIKEFQEGVDGTGIRPGIIGEIGLSNPIRTGEMRVLEAAALAQQATGAALQIHPGQGENTPFEIVKNLEQWGVDLSRTIISHIDRTFTKSSQVIDLARTGVVVELDMFGREWAYYPLADRYQLNDRERIEWVCELLSNGYGDQVVVGSDMCQKAYLRKYGGVGYSHILENVLPMMRRHGISAEEIDNIRTATPARLLSIEKV